MSRPHAIVSSDVANAWSEEAKVSWRKELMALMDVEPSAGSSAAA